jgi:hypothetical protein
LASLVACFVALHIRRQFSSPTAKTVPHFAGAHLAVAALASLSIWVAMPLVQAWMLRLPPWGPIGAHAVAGLLLALVVCWRQAIVLLLGLPVLIFSETRMFSEGTPWGDYLLGKDPGLSFAAIALVFVAHLAAGKFLLGVPDQSVAVSDDFALETPRQETAGGRLDELVLRTRDGVVRRRLADAGFGWWSVQRWRVPSSTSWTQMALAFLLGAALCLISVWLGRDLEAALFGMIITVSVMIIVPFHSWHTRRGTIATEILRPVTRGQYVRQVALGIAWDVFAWTALASVFSLAVVLSIYQWVPTVFRSFGDHLLFLWAVTAFAYGMGLATIRSRYWLPLMIFMMLAWTLVVAYGVAMAQLHLSGQQVTRVHPPLAFLLAWILASAVLTGLTLRRWRRADVP